MTTSAKNASLKKEKTQKKGKKRLKIGGHVYTLIFSGDLKDLGETIYNDRIIKIAKAHRTIQESTLIHELLHTINSQLEHTLLDSLAEQIYQVLKDNKLLNMDRLFK